MLSALLLIPFAGALGLLCWPGELATERIRRAALGLLVLQLLWSLRVLLVFDVSDPGLQLQESFAWVDSIGLDYRLGVDGLAMPLVLVNAASPWCRRSAPATSASVPAFTSPCCSGSAAR